MKKDLLSIMSTDLVDFSAITTIIGGLNNVFATKTEAQTILSLVDLTSLEGKDTPESISTLCNKAIKYKTASVCVYPTLVKHVKKYISGTTIRCASVAGGFPSGQTSLEIKKEEVRFAIDEGADEIDFVISRNLLLQHEFEKLFDEIASIKDICGEKIKLKTILETGELPTYEYIRKASEVAIYAGSDFIKTSTGKISVNATLEAACIMLLCIKNYYNKTGKKIGIKPSGGISDTNIAVQYLRLTETILDHSWINPNLFRFGASRLVDSIINLNSTSTY